MRHENPFLTVCRNPWGRRDARGRIGEWNGRWSDGSEEWTPYWMEKLDHRFKDDGVFWMEYGDMLQTFGYIYRTRLFDESWTVIQQWASCSVSWVTGYLRTKFLLDVKKSGMVVIAMAQVSHGRWATFCMSHRVKFRGLTLNCSWTRDTSGA